MRKGMARCGSDVVGDVRRYPTGSAGLHHHSPNKGNKPNLLF